MSKLKMLFLLMIMLPVVNSCAANQEVGGMTAQQAFADPKVAQMVEAASAGDFKKVDAQIQAGANVNAIGKDGVTPLIWQTYSWNIKAMEKMLQVGANPNYRDAKDHFSALYMAIEAKRADLLIVLLRYKGDPNLMDPNGEPLLDTAISALSSECVELLLKSGADVNIVNSNGKSPARSAVALGQFDLVILLLEHGLSRNLQDLALSVQNRDVPPDSDAQRLKDKVIEMLKTRGVTYPDPRYSAPKPPPGW
jgi:ankyrin repeat protein